MEPEVMGYEGTHTTKPPCDSSRCPHLCCRMEGWAEGECTSGPQGEDVESYQDWIKDIKPGSVASHPLVPIVYTKAPSKR